MKNMWKASNSPWRTLAASLLQSHPPEDNNQISLLAHFYNTNSIVRLTSAVSFKLQCGLDLLDKGFPQHIQ